MPSRLLPALIAGAALALAPSADAASFKMNFRANQFVNGGVQFPGYSGPVSGSIRWEASLIGDPITALTSIEFSLFGNAFSLADVGIGGNGSTQTTFGGLAQGANAVVGNGLFNDFLIVFDRVNPSISAFAFSLEGKAGAIWWTPAETFIEIIPEGTVPLPSSAALVLLPLAMLLAHRRARQPIAQRTAA